MVRIEYEAIDSIGTFEDNPKEHDIGALVESIKRFGFVSPLLLDEDSGRIVAGHGRLKALAWMRRSGHKAENIDNIKIGYNNEWLVPVVRGHGFGLLVEAEAYLVTDNRTVELGNWDNTKLMNTLNDIAHNEFVDGKDNALYGTGFDGDDLDLLNFYHQNNVDLSPKDTSNVLSKYLNVRHGDVWQCRNNFVACGTNFGHQIWGVIMGKSTRNRIDGIFGVCPYGALREFKYNASDHVDANTALVASTSALPPFATMDDLGCAFELISDVGDLWVLLDCKDTQLLLACLMTDRHAVAVTDSTHVAFNMLAKIMTLDGVELNTVDKSMVDHYCKLIVKGE